MCWAGSQRPLGERYGVVALPYAIASAPPHHRLRMLAVHKRRLVGALASCGVGFANVARAAVQRGQVGGILGHLVERLGPAQHIAFTSPPHLTQLVGMRASESTRYIEEQRRAERSVRWI